MATLQLPHADIPIVMDTCIDKRSEEIPLPQDEILVESNRYFSTESGSDEISGHLPVMSKKEIKTVALEHSGYSTPALNDQLYLHYKGYQKIENLEEYVNLKALWLDSNGLQKIENLNHLSSLRCLFLQRNLFTRIENVEGLTNLVQLGKSI